MTNIRAAGLLLFLLSGMISADDRLPPAQREWLELVDPIITKTERQVFDRLESDEERSRFIQLFWKRRDPHPDTGRNEFYDQYMERVRYADRFFGHDAPGPGHLTERGRFYLILGPPLERQAFATQSDVYPLELWHYKGEREYGLPPFYYLIFFQDRGIGAYRLYSPDVDGPEKLIVPGVRGASLGRSRAFNLIKNISGELAGAALSYIPGDSSPGITSFSSASLVAGIQNMAEKKFNDAYARQFLYYKDFVETEYSHNYIESRAQIKIFRQAGLHYLHWSLEPSRINFAERDGRNSAVFQLVLRIEDGEGRRVLEKEDEIPLDIDPETASRHAGGIFAFQDMLPVIPGRYRLFFLLRNKTGQEFSSFDREFFVAEPGPEPAISNLLVYQGRSRLGSARRDRLKAFTFNGVQYLCNAENNCIPGSEVGVYGRVHNLRRPGETDFLLRVMPAGGTEPTLEIRRALTGLLREDGVGFDCYPVSLADLKPGYYRMEVVLEDRSGGIRLETGENFILLSQALPATPWAYSREHVPPPNPEHLLMTGAQYFEVGRLEASENALRQALGLKDDSATRLLLARVLFAGKRYRESLDLARPVYESTGNRDAARQTAASLAELERWEEALVILRRLLETSSDPALLNLAAHCYIQLGRPDEARPMLEKSLEVLPDQPAVRETLARLKQ